MLDVQSTSLKLPPVMVAKSLDGSIKKSTSRSRSIVSEFKEPQIIYCESKFKFHKRPFFRSSNDGWYHCTNPAQHFYEGVWTVHARCTEHKSNSNEEISRETFLLMSVHDV